MKTLILPLLLLVFVISGSYAQQLYSRAYGNPRNPAIIYIHGGPRGNSTLFEGTTAAIMADKGFYVIVYDRRGEGRSADSSATMTFTEAIADLDRILEKYKIKKTALIGHSFGGIVATKYTAARPEKVERLILVDALISQQESYDHILKSTAELALAKKDTASLRSISFISTLDRESARYRKLCYDLASAYDYFRMPYPTPEFKQLEARYRNSEYEKNNIRNDQAPTLFYNNERQVNIDIRQILKSIQKMDIKLFGIYGRQDRIFSGRQLDDIRHLIGTKRFALINNCAHYPFVDQQPAFITDVLKFMK